MFIRIEDPRDVSVVQFRSGVDLKVCKDNSDNGRRVECDDQYFMCYKARIECDVTNATARKLLSRVSKLSSNCSLVRLSIKPPEKV